MIKMYFLKKAITKVIACTTFLSFGLLTNVDAQFTFPRPWSDGFSTASGSTPVGYISSGYWGAGEDPMIPGNPGAMIATGHIIGTTDMTSYLITPNISGILAIDSFKFDFKHIEYLGAAIQPAAVGSIYFKVFVSIDGGANFTQIDSVTANGLATWTTQSYSLASYAGQTLTFKIESTSLTPASFLFFIMDNFSVNGSGTPPPCVPPVVNLGADTVLCNGATAAITLDAGVSGAMYRWSDNPTTQTLSQTLDINAAGTYWVEVTNGPNCSATDTIVIATGNTPVAPPAGSVTVTGTYPTYTFSINNPSTDVIYTWNFCDGSNATGQSITRTFTDTTSCNIEIEISNACGSVSIFHLITHNSTSIIDRALNNVAVHIFPNPANNVLMLKNESNHTPKSVVVYDLLGKEVKIVVLNNSSSQQIDISELAPGMYAAVIELEAGNVLRKFEILR